MRPYALLAALMLVACEGSTGPPPPDYGMPVREGPAALIQITQEFRERGGQALITLTDDPSDEALVDLRDMSLTAVEQVPDGPVLKALIPPDRVDTVAARPYVVAIEPEPGPPPIASSRLAMDSVVVDAWLSRTVVAPDDTLTLLVRVENRRQETLVVTFGGFCLREQQVVQEYRYSPPRTLQLNSLSRGCQDAVVNQEYPAATAQTDHDFYYAREERVGPLLPGSYTITVDWLSLEWPDQVLRFRVEAP